MATRRDVVQALRAMGISRQDRVALILPNGAEMAVAFLAVAAGATCAPLNPAHSADELASYLAQLKAQALIVQADMDAPARADCAVRCILSLIELWPRGEAEAGLFTLTGEERPCPAPHGFAQPDDVGLVLHTTGSTSALETRAADPHESLCVSVQHSGSSCTDRERPLPECYAAVSRAWS